MNKLEITKEEKKKYIKNIEKHLRNYPTYKIAISNLEKQLSYVTSIEKPSFSSADIGHIKKFPSLQNIKTDLNELYILKDSIEQALLELSDLEKKYVECRYFKKWSVNKSALEVGYSEKAIFVIRNHVMEKLLISLGGIIYLE